MATNTSKSKYDPKGLYFVKKGAITHTGNGKSYKAGDGESFDLSHLDALRVEFLVDEMGIVAPVTKGTKVQ